MNKENFILNIEWAIILLSFILVGLYLIYTGISIDTGEFIMITLCAILLFSVFNMTSTTDSGLK